MLIAGDFDPMLATARRAGEDDRASCGVAFPRIRPVRWLSLNLGEVAGSGAVVAATLHRDSRLGGWSPTALRSRPRQGVGHLAGADHIATDTGLLESIWADKTVPWNGPFVFAAPRTWMSWTCACPPISVHATNTASLLEMQRLKPIAAALISELPGRPQFGARPKTLRKPDVGQVHLPGKCSRGDTPSPPSCRPSTPTQYNPPLFEQGNSSGTGSSVGWYFHCSGRAPLGPPRRALNSILSRELNNLNVI